MSYLASWQERVQFVKCYFVMNKIWQIIDVQKCCSLSQIDCGSKLSAPIGTRERTNQALHEFINTHISSAKGVLNSVADSGSAKNETLVKFFTENSMQMISDVNVKRTQSKKRKQDSTK